MGTPQRVSGDGESKGRKITPARTTPYFGKFQMWSDISGLTARDTDSMCNFLPRVARPGHTGAAISQ